MLVYERMTRDPITIYPDMSVSEALNLMRTKGVRRFPVLDPRSKRLIGIITEKELLYASPSPATSLSMHEINYLLSKLTVAKVMTANPLTVQEDTPIEEAALTMVDNEIGALPVVRGEAVVGIITETDIFKTFIELFAARERGVRLTMLVPEKKGELAAIAARVSALGGNFTALGTFKGEDTSNRLLTVKVEGIAQEKLVATMKELGCKIIDARNCTASSACEL
jgi:acetoin utilization protein AcuB